MATAVPYPRKSVRVAGIPGRRFDNKFFSGMAALMLVMVAVGFAPSYYLAGVFRAPLPSPIIHVHAVLFSLWILLLITQTSLVSAGQVRIHRRLGIAGMVLACVMVVSGVLAATDTLVHLRSPVPGRNIQAFYIVPMSSMLVFAGVMLFAFLQRANPAAHKRLVLVATSSLMVAALARWPVPFVHRNAFHATYVIYGVLALLFAYDLWSMRTVHRATLWASAFLVFIFQVRVPIAQTATWHSFAGWVQSIAR